LTALKRPPDLGGGTTGSVSATKCKGGQVGFYNHHGQLGSSQIQHDLTAKMPAFPKFRDFKSVTLTVAGPAVTSVPPESSPRSTTPKSGC
jgi:hypothetical protein